MKKNLLQISIALLLALFICGKASAQSAETIQNIDKFENNLMENTPIIFADSAVARYNIYDRMEYYKIPSVSIAVINNGKLEWAKAYGFADVKEGRKADTNTVYQAASISKSLNAFCIVKLAQDGRLSLTQDIREYLKSWTFPDNELSKGKTITLKNLLSHTAGLSVHGFRGYTRDEKIPEINEILNGVPPANSEAVIPVYAPGTIAEYSGGGTLITKKILDDNVAANYDSLMKAEVLNPLKMNHSSYLEPLKINITNFAVAYDANMAKVPGKYHLYPELAPDALWTTPSDLSKFIISIQQSLAQKNESLLSSSTAAEMVTPVISSSSSALGVFIENYGNEKYFTHSGANEGFSSIFYGSFTSGRGIVVMVNSDNGAIIREIVKGVADIYNWKGFYESEIRRLINIPDSIAKKYKGTYVSQNPEFKITIKKDGNDLLLTTKGEENLERMLFVAEDKFYLPSSPHTFAEFITGQDGTIETLVVKENGNVIIKADKIK